MWRAVDDAPSGRVADIAFAADGTPWVATAGGSHFPGGLLAYYDGHTWNEVTTGQGLTSVSAVALGPDGVVAVGTDLGLGIYRGGEWRLLKDGPTQDSATSVAVTPDGAAWFGFGDQSVSTPGGGLSRFDGHDWEYHLDNAVVNALAVSPDGSLWVGAGCNVQRFDGVKWEAVALCGEYLLTGNVSDIDFTPDGSAWVATGFGLLNIGGERMAYERLINSVSVAPDGSIWANGWEGAQDSFYVARFDWQNWTTYRGADSYPGGFLVGAVTPDGLVWGTAPERRLVSFDGHSWTDESAWRFYYNADGLPLDNVTAIGVAPAGELWVGLEGGVARFDGAWTTYLPEYELASDPVRAIAFGSGGGVWLGATYLDMNLAAGVVYP
jgi:sugar lactone lactonase YvrE